MRDLLILAVHLLVTVAKLLRPGGARAVAAESLLLKHQLQISNRSRRLVMDVFTRRIIGFGVEHAYVDGVSVCRMSGLRSRDRRFI
jgi:hypothetical protein